MWLRSPCCRMWLARALMLCLLALHVVPSHGQFVTRIVGPGGDGVCLDGTSSATSVTSSFSLTNEELGYPSSWALPIKVDVWEVTIEFQKKASRVSTAGDPFPDKCFLFPDGDAACTVVDPPGGSDRSFHEVEFVLRTPSMPGGPASISYDLIPTGCFSQNALPGTTEAQATIVLRSEVGGPHICDKVAFDPNFPENRETPTDFNNGVEPPSNNAAGTYEVVAMDRFDRDPLCFQNVTISLRPELYIEVDTDAFELPSCNGDSDGSITFLVTGGAGDAFIVSVPDGASIDGGNMLRANGISAGTGQEFAFEDSLGNRGWITVDMPEPDEFMFTDAALMVTDALCPYTPLQGLSNTGIFEFQVQGGTPPYSIVSLENGVGDEQWNDPADTGLSGSVTGLRAGTYNLQLEDANGCTTEPESFTVSDPEDFGLVLSTQTEPTCFGRADGSGSLIVDGGTGEITIATDPEAGTTDVTGRSVVLTDIAAVTRVVVTDSRNCQSDEILVDIGEPMEISFEVVEFTNPTCIGFSDGTAKLEESGGSGSYTLISVSPSGGVNTDDYGVDGTLSGLSDQEYTVVLEDSMVPGCTGSATINLSDPAPVEAMLELLNPLDCKDGNNALLSASASGGSGSGYSIQSYTVSEVDVANPIDPMANMVGLELQNAEAGIYQVVVTDGNNCPSDPSNAVTVFNPSLLDGNVEDVSCPGDGRLRVTGASGGTDSTYSIRLQSASHSSDPAGLSQSGLPFGEAISVILENSKGCSNEIDPGVVLSDPSAINGNLVVVPETCPADGDGMVGYAVEGGTGPYSITASRTPTTEDPESTFWWSGASGDANVVSIQVIDDRGCMAPLDDLSFDSTATTALSSFLSDSTGPTCANLANGWATIVMEGGTGDLELVDVTPTGMIESTNKLVQLSDEQVTYTFEDENACKMTGTVSLTPMYELSAGVSVQQPILCPSDLATLEVTPLNGPADYMIGGETYGTLTFLIPNVPAGPYNELLTDGNGCEFQVSIDVAGVTDLSATVDDSASTLEVSCVGVADGVVQMFFSGGTGLFKVTSPVELEDLEADMTYEVLSATAAGSYEILYEDANGCTESETVQVTSPTPPELEVVASLGCAGAGGGVMQVAVTNMGGDAFTITGVERTDGMPIINPIEINGDTIRNLDYSVSYTVSVEMDVSGCTGSTSLTLDASSEPNPLQVSVVRTIDALCFGEASGSVELSIMGGTQPHSAFAQDLSPTPIPVLNTEWLSPILSGLPPNADLVAVVTDSHGCIAESSSFVIDDPLLLELDVEPIAGSCSQNNGGATLTAMGGVGGYTVVSPAGAGAYPTLSGLSTTMPTTVVVRDGNNCEVTESFQAPNNEDIVIQLLNTVPISCEEASTGIVEFRVSGGVPFEVVTAGDVPYLVSGDSTWDADNDIFQVGGLGPDASVTVTDSLDCSITEDFTIEEYVQGLVVRNQDVTCFGFSDGILEFTASNNAPGATWDLYEWTNGAMEPVVPAPDVQDAPEDVVVTIGNLAANTYILRLIDSNGCIEAETGTVNDGLVITASFPVEDRTNPTCNGEFTGSVVIVPSGGSGAYTYDVTPSVTIVGDTFSGMSSQSYTVTVTNVDSGCESAVISIPQLQDPDEVTFSVEDITCAGAADGEGRVRVFDINGGDGIFLAANISPGTVTEIQSGSEFVVSGLNFDDTLTVRDSNSCPGTMDLSLAPAIQAIDVSNPVPISPLCNGNANGMYSVSSISGGRGPTYVLSPDQGTLTASDPWEVSDLSAGTATFTVTDGAGCTSESFSVEVAERPALEMMIETGSIVPISCPGVSDGGTNVIISGGVEPYGVTPSEGSASAVSSTTFTLSGLGNSAMVTVRDGNDCELAEDLSSTFNDPDPVEAIITASTPVLCAETATGTATVQVSGGVVGEFEGMSGDVNIVRDANDPTLFTVTGIPGTTVTTAEFSDDRGCSDTLQFSPPEFEDPPRLTGDAPGSSINTPTCVGRSDGTAQITVSGGQSPSNYIVTSPGAPIQMTQDSINTWTAENIPQGLHVFPLSDSNGCTGDTFTLDMDDPPSVDLQFENVVDPTCNGETDASADLQFSGGVNFVFDIIAIEDSGGNEVYPANSALATRVDDDTWSMQGFPDGEFTVFYEDENGCGGQKSVTFTEPTTLVATPEDYSCFGEARILVRISGGQGPGSYSLVSVVEVDENDVETEIFYATSVVSDETILIGNLLFSTVIRYKVSVTDDNSCASLVVNPLLPTRPTQPRLESLVETQPSCNGVADGSVTFAFTGGSGSGYEITMVDPTGPMVSGLMLSAVPGSTVFTIDFVDGRQCPGVQFDYTLAEPSSYSASVVSSTDPSCPTTADGSVTIEHAGGVGPYSIDAGTVRSPAMVTSSTEVAMMDGNLFEFTTMDSNGCEFVVSVTLNAPAIGVAVPRDVSCRSPSDGRVEITFQGTQGSEELVSASTSTTEVGPPILLSGIVDGGSWSATLRDACGLLDPIGGTVTYPAQPGGISMNVVTPPTCFTADDGVIELTVSGGTSPYRILSITPQYAQSVLPTASFSSMVTISNTRAGAFTAQVEDAHGCIMELPFSLDQPRQIVIENLMEIQAPSCSGAEDGVYELRLGPSVGIGSQPPFSVANLPYAIMFSSPGAPEFNAPTYTNTLIGLREGTTTILVSDANGCMNDIEVSARALVSFGLTVTTKQLVRCRGEANGEVSINVPEWPRRLWYTLEPGVVTTPTEIGENERPFVVSQVAGNIEYTFRVEDEFGCFDSITFELDDPPSLLADFEVHVAVSCEGANDAVLRLDLGGGGGYYLRPLLLPTTGTVAFENMGDAYGDAPYVFESGPWVTTGGGLGPGTYSISVTDTLFCNEAAAVTVREPQLRITAPRTGDAWRMYRPAAVGWWFDPGQDPTDHRVLTVTVMDMDDNPVRTITTSTSTALGVFNVIPHHYFSGFYKVALSYDTCGPYESEPFRIEGLEPGAGTS